MDLTTLRMLCSCVEAANEESIQFERDMGLFKRGSYEKYIQQFVSPKDLQYIGSMVVTMQMVELGYW